MQGIGVGFLLSHCHHCFRFLDVVVAVGAVAAVGVVGAGHCYVADADDVDCGCYGYGGDDDGCCCCVRHLSPRQNCAALVLLVEESREPSSCPRGHRVN